MPGLMLVRSLILALVLAAGSCLALWGARFGGWRTFALTWLATSVASGAVYLLPTEVDGSDSFHLRLLLLLVGFTVLGLAMRRHARSRARIPVLLGAAGLGVFTPPVLLVGTIVIACEVGDRCLS